MYEVQGRKRKRVRKTPNTIASFTEVVVWVPPKPKKKEFPQVKKN